MGRDPAALEDAWEHLGLYLKMMRIQAGVTGSDFVVVSIPDASLIYPTLTLPNYPLRNIAIEQRLRIICEQQGITYVDLTAPLKDAAVSKSDQLYYPRDRHLTAAGHKVVADALSIVLRRPATSSN